MPSNDQLRLLKKGDRIVESKLALTQTDASGRYTFTSANTRLEGLRAGTVNLYVTTIGQSAPEQWYFSREVAPDHSGKLRLSVAEGTDLTVPKTFSATRTLARSAAVAASLNCYWMPYRYTDRVPVVVGTSFIPTGDVGNTVTYAKGNSHSFGVGFKADKKGWSASGSMKTTMTNSTTVSGKLYHSETNLWWTNFRYWEDYDNCYGHRLRPADWQGSFYSRPTTDARVARVCEDYDPHVSFHTNIGRAHNLSGGAATGGIIGINLSAESDYSTTIDSEFWSGYKNGYQVCGENEPVGSNPGFVEAYANIGSGGCAALSRRTRIRC